MRGGVKGRLATKASTLETRDVPLEDQEGGGLKGDC